MITDLVQNAVEAGGREVYLDVTTSPATISVSVKDNGKGMDAETLKRISDPFYTEPGTHDHRKVGLGIPLLMQTAEACNGAAKIDSEPGKGTCVTFSLDATHLDTPPMGNLPGTVLGLMTFPGDYDLILTRKTLSDSYQNSRKELIDTLGDLESAGNLVLARDFLTDQEKSLKS